MNFVVFAPNPWHDLWRNRQQIFSRLAARQHRVLYVEPARASLADWRRGRVAPAQVRGPALVQERPNLALYRIPALLPTRATGDRFDQTSDRGLAWHLRHTLRTLNFTDPVLWLYRPARWQWAAQAIPHRLLVYHITDDYAAFAHLDDAARAALLVEERGLLAAADLTLVTAPRLLEIKGPAARHSVLVANGVDVTAFQRAAMTAPRPAVPRLGYSGHVSARLDLPLLRELAMARPDWLFEFAGSEWDVGVAEELAALKALPNVLFRGLLPVEAVPDFVASLAVGLIPYRVTDETRAISSLKLYEYLAAGRPVVSARVPAAEAHADVVRMADATVATWVEQIDAALREANDPTLVAARQAVAAQNTWHQRVNEIEQALKDVLAQTV
ncbi:MAG: glycosyltransferase [Anaerolineae bacterium]